MAKEDIDRIKASLANETTVIAGVSALLTDLSQRVREGADDPDALRAIADELDANNASLAKAVADNTPGGVPV